MSTLFSIIIPCYNQAHFLPDCIDSLVAQSYQNWEAIIVNDGSTDTTSGVALSYCKSDARVKLVEKGNGGLSSARNHGIQQATGQRLIFLDSDDFMYPNCLLEIFKLLKPEDDKVLIQYGYTYISEDKKSILHTVLPSQQTNLIPGIFSKVLGPCHTICISKKLCDSIGFFDEDLKSLEDWDYWIRAAKVSASQKTIMIPLVYYRYVRTSMSRNAFVMYDAFKKVALRAPFEDLRIKESNLLNKNYDFNSVPVLQEFLIRCLGVSIMQGQIEKSIVLFQKESPKSIMEYRPEEFELMCSYLSFRYWYSRSDVNDVFDKIYPNFIVFFKRMGYPNQSLKVVIFHIFKRHYYYRNTFTYGGILGSLFNFLLRFKFKQK